MDRPTSRRVGSEPTAVIGRYSGRRAVARRAPCPRCAEQHYFIRYDDIGVTAGLWIVMTAAQFDHVFEIPIPEEDHAAA
jgi:hypothetical protein